MIRVLIPYDNEDLKRGEYFDVSQQNLTYNLADKKYISYQLLDTKSCCDSSIDNYISTYKGKPFIFIAYAHGSETAIVIDKEEYVNLKNAYLFGETLFYACSCLSALELGKGLIDNGCKVFIGYNTRITTASNESEDVFRHCENAFISHFLTTGKTIEGCLAYMYSEYQRMQVHLVNNYGVFEASVLGNNLDAFTILPEPIPYKLTNRDFYAK